MSSIVLGIVGLVATTVVAALGLYFTARARTAPLRETLFIRQLDATVEILRLVDRARLYVTIALGPDPEYFARAHEDLLKCMPELSRLQSLAAAILPTEIFIELSRVSDNLSDFIHSAEEGHPDPKLRESISESAMRIALMGRQLLGIDELSEESLGLFATHDALEHLSRLRADDFRRTPSEPAV